MCDFIKVIPENPQINYKRTNPFPLRHLIKNFEEVKAALKNTDYSWMAYE